MIKTDCTFKFKLLEDKTNQTNCYKLFPSDYTLNGYINNLNAYYNGKENTGKNIYMGIFAFLEFFIKYFEKDIGITGFEISRFNSDQEQKYGISGVGYRGKDFVTVSFKFNGNEFLTDGNSQITEYLVQSTYRSKFDTTSKKSIYNIFTDNKEIHPRTIENFITGTLAEDKVNVYNLDYIKSRVDGNKLFWNYLFETYNQAIKEQKGSNSIILDDDQLTTVKDLAAYSFGRYRVIWPTGTGKTEIMMGHMIEAIKKSKNKKMVFLIVSPRLLLISQTMTKYANKLKSEKISKFNFINYSCGNCDQDELNVLNCGYEEAIATLSIDELKKVIHNATGPCFVFTTYKSVGRILDAKIHFNIMNCDEAHNIVKGQGIPKEGMEKIVSYEVKEFIDMQVFYTATQAFSSIPDEDDVKEPDNSICMSNENQFGKIISKRSPKEKINEGKIVPPRICTIRIKTDDIKKYCKGGEVEDFEKNNELNSFIVWSSFKEVSLVNRKNSFDYKKNATKLLVTCHGMPSYEGIITSEVFKEFQAKNPDVSVFGISSKKIYIHGKFYSDNPTNRKRLMDELDGMSYNQSYILFHINIIGEGYDAPGINAVLPLKDLAVIKSSQTTGRGMRLHPLDRARLTNGSLIPDDRYYNEFYKPFVYICFVNYEGCVKSEKYKNVVQSIISDLGYYPAEVCFTENYDGKTILITPERPNEQHKVPDNVDYDFMEVITAFEAKEKVEADEKMIKKQKDNNKTFKYYMDKYNDICKNPHKYSEVEKKNVVEKLKKGC
jgi:superfamily II DNA or RNA helicase